MQCIWCIMGAINGLGAGRGVFSQRGLGRSVGMVVLQRGRRMGGRKPDGAMIVLIQREHSDTPLIRIQAAFL